MKLNLKTDYALRVLIYLQQQERASIKEIADYFKINKNHLSVVVNKLSELNYIDSTTGPGGGISLKEKTFKKSLAEIVKNFEDFEIVECFNKEKNQCRLNPSCKLKSILKSANRKFINELEQYSIQDIR